ncbi:glycosyltransferase family A protein [Vreelandella zhanjiangensis]|uniref:glycosyltransferase family A protein n=1 Tax=Vreelandella zhanjiangensis TaxID=1121960 RepID=UPI001FC91AC1|nr:glycosyltransferase family A protein [Halomonas zhanjiangensis]
MPRKPASDKDASAITEIEQSPWFDAEWYSKQYPDVAVSGMSPAEHYFALGEGWGRQAGPRFDTEYYLERHQDVARAKVSPLLHFIRNGEKEGRSPIQLMAFDKEELLWQQTAISSALKALHGLLAHQDAWEASYAAWALGRWYAWKGEWQRCADILASRHQYHDTKPATPAPWLLEVEALIHCGQLVNAWQRIQQLIAAYPDYPDTSLALSNLLAVQASIQEGRTATQADALTEQFRLQHINALFLKADLHPIALIDPSQPLTLDNLKAENQAITGTVASDDGLVSIIMPVFNAEAHLATALRSLAEQTYANLEVLVVDDASTDGSLTIAQAFSQEDARFKVLSQPANQGAYAARNRGLAASKGDFITVHDSDDWSHPQKIEMQVAGLISNPEWNVCSSDMVRCYSSLLFRRWRVEALDGWIYRNTSSLMMRRKVVDSLGYWDKVRCSADTEYLHRICAAYGNKTLGVVLKGVPLAFCREQPQSLSQTSTTHLVTQFNGIRFDYMQAAAQWHASAEQPSDLYLPANPETRPFPAPAANLPG